MFLFVLAAGLPLVQSVTVRVGKPDNAAAAKAEARSDSARRDRDERNANRRPPRRIAVTPELERSAFKDSRARELVHRAREARMSQDSALLSYDATAYQRLSVGFGLRAFGRDRLMMRHENVSRVRWSRASGVWIELKGRRTAVPMLTGRKGGGNVEMDEASPIPYYPGREALWIGGDDGLAKAEVDDREMVHPIASGAEAYYRYQTGDSLTIRLSDGKTIRLRELRIEPREPQWKLSVGSFWFDVESGQLVRAAYRFSAEMDIWQVAKEEGDADMEDVPIWVKPMITPMRANLESVTIDYGLYGGRFWLPRAQAAVASARVSFMRVPVRIEESFKYAEVNGVDSLPQLPPSEPTRRAMRDSLFGSDTTAWRDLPPEERKAREKKMAEMDSTRRAERRAKREEDCRTSGSWVRSESRFSGSLRVATRVPCDTMALARSPDLPPSIYEPGEELFGGAELDELAKSLSFSLQPGWAPQKPTVNYSFELWRYNRVEGLAPGVEAKSVLGQGYSASAIARFGIADRSPNAELTLSRSNGRRQLGATVYRQLRASNDWGEPLAFGSSLSALLFGRDEGFYYRSWGGELASSNVRGGGFQWRLFGEHHQNARANTDWSLANAFSNVKFIDNVESKPGTIAGASARWIKSLGLNPQGWRLLTHMRAEAAGGSFDYTRGLLDVTVSHGLGERATVALTGSAGAAGGSPPPQRLFYLGGPQTVRGQYASPTEVGHVGNSYWFGRFELGSSFSGARPVIFGDLGWAGDRRDWSKPGRPMSGAGIGTSFLDGLFRFDASRGIYPSKKMRYDLYLEARF